MPTQQPHRDDHDICHIPQCAVMFGVDQPNKANQAAAVRHLMKQGHVPPFEEFLNGKGAWRYATLRDARDAYWATGQKKPRTTPQATAKGGAA